jgi:hypothetical protein
MQTLKLELEGEGGRSAFLGGTIKRKVQKDESLGNEQVANRNEDSAGAKGRCDARCLRLRRWATRARIQRARCREQARTRLADRTVHLAVMLTATPAASRKIGIRIGGERGRDQRKAEQHEQQ